MLYSAVEGFVLRKKKKKPSRLTQKMMFENVSIVYVCWAYIWREVEAQDRTHE